ncbi:MAG: DUF4276 family protein [Bacteroidales bacterium]|nr:DUF4276 family protein [Bacteroidales bacterium]
MNVLTIAYTTEGKTDKRFLGNVIRRTFEEIAWECAGEITVYDPQHLEVSEHNFINQVTEAALEAKWANVLCVHTDADDSSDNAAFNFKINPAFDNINNNDGNICKNLVAVVPITMTEAWMLINKDILKDEIGTTKTNNELQLTYRINNIENIANPKDLITVAIREAYIDVPRKRFKTRLSDLYSPLSQRILLDELLHLSSYRKFREAARRALIELNYLNE